MMIETSKHGANTILPTRQRWEAPAIVLERSLQVSAQDGGPSSDPNVGPNGLLGPLSTSGGGTGGICGFPQ